MEIKSSESQPLINQPDNELAVKTPKYKNAQIHKTPLKQPAENKQLESEVADISIVTKPALEEIAKGPSLVEKFADLFYVSDDVFKKTKVSIFMPGASVVIGQNIMNRFNSSIGSKILAGLVGRLTLAVTTPFRFLYNLVQVPANVIAAFKEKVSEENIIKLEGTVENGAIGGRRLSVSGQYEKALLVSRAALQPFAELQTSFVLQTIGLESVTIYGGQLSRNTYQKAIYGIMDIIKQANLGQGGFVVGEKDKATLYS